MNDTDRSRFRLADQIRQRLLRLAQQNLSAVRADLQGLLGATKRLVQLDHSLMLCEQHGLPSAGTRILTELQSAAADLPYEITGATSRLTRWTLHPIQAPGLRDLIGEVQQITDEFEGYEYSAAQRTLSVRTKPIVLEGLHLGRFQIQLFLDRLDQTRSGTPYRVMALNPNPAASSDSVTHPHVRDERLCEGDASPGIRGALEEGRLCDFFLLVRAVLETYNAGSPYVALENWSGRSCHECGTGVDEDDSCCCESCDHDYCLECMTTCMSCDASLCIACIEKCPLCDELTCTDCLKPCPRCGKRTCAHCRENEICTTCQTNEEPNDDTPAPGIDPGNSGIDPGNLTAASNPASPVNPETPRSPADSEYTVSANTQAA